MAVLVFDGDCGMCTSCGAFTVKWIRPPAQVVPWQACDLPSLGLTPDQCSTALQFVSDELVVHSGSRAVTALLRSSGWPWTWLGAVGDAPGIDWLAAAVYRTVAANRPTTCQPGTRRRDRSSRRSAHSG